MKIFLDTSLHFSAAIGSEVSRRLIDEAIRRRWRVMVSDYVLNELYERLIGKLKSPVRKAVI